MFVQSKNFGHQPGFKCGDVNGTHNSGDHIHQYFELEMVTAGEIEIKVSGNTYIAKAGDIAVIPPFKVHSFHTPDFVSMKIYTMSDFFLPASVSREELHAERDCFIFTPSKALWDYLIATEFRELKTVHKFTPELIHRLQACVHLILSEFLCATRVTKKAEHINALSEMLLYVSEHYKEDVSIVSVAEAIGCSPKYVSRCFSSIPGISFRDFVNKLRIEDAKALLSDGDDTVISIAIECGFMNESSFYRVFREIVGVTPTEYRRDKRQV